MLLILQHEVKSTVGAPCTATALDVCGCVIEGTQCHYQSTLRKVHALTADRCCKKHVEFATPKATDNSSLLLRTSQQYTNRLAGQQRLHAGTWCKLGKAVMQACGLCCGAPSLT
jgi:hypothetical protein